MRNSIPEDKIQEILDKTSLEQIVAKYISLKPQGKNLVGLCPFHHEDTPSFTLNPTKGLFYCFGCGAGGNAIGFLMKIEKYTFVESIERLALETGVNVQTSVREKKVDSEKSSFYEINAIAQKAYHYILTNTTHGKDALAYLENRGLSLATIEKFGLGYALDGWDKLIRIMSKKNISVEQLHKLGLVTERQEGKGYYDRFRARIMFPIYNLSGLVVGFGGRLLGKETGPKYLNSPETMLFQKSALLYGMNIARDEIRREDKVILVEGYMDVISAHQHGVSNVVASLGTAFTKEQARIIKRYTDNVVIVYDPDEAGSSAALRGLSVLKENNCIVKVLTLPEGLDPDEFLKKYGAQRFMEAVENDSLDLIEYKVDYIAKSLNLDEINEKGKLLDFVAEDIATIGNMMKIDHYIKFLANKLGASEQSITAEIANRTRKSKTMGEETTTAIPKPLLEVAEDLLIKYLLENPNELEWFQETMSLQALQVPENRLILKLYIQHQEIANQGKRKTFNQFVHGLDEELKTYLAKLMNASQETYSVEDCIFMIKNRWYKLQIENLKKEISAAEERKEQVIVDAMVMSLHDLQRQWHKSKTIRR